MFNALRGGSKEQRETLKQLKASLQALEQQLTHRREELNRAIELYKQSSVTKWEYLQCSDGELEQFGGLGRLGKLGWELVSFTTYTGLEIKGIHTHKTVYVFKRQIVDISPSVLAPFSDIQDLETQMKETAAQVKAIEGPNSWVD